MEKNIANILKGAPKGLSLWCRSLSRNVKLVEVVLHKDSQFSCNEYVIVTENTDGNKVFFNQWGYRMSSFYGKSVTHDTDLFPNDVLEWDSNGIEFLFFNTEHPEGTVIMDAFDEELSPVPWIIGTDYIWSCDFEQWDAVRIHKFAFDCCRFATEDETKEFFDYMHSVNLDFKDGEPVRINQETGDVVTEYRYKQKKLFLNTLTDICKRWKDTISDEDYDEVIKKFVKKIKKDKL